MENYNYNNNTILKFLRKVLNEINRDYIDSGMRTAFLMKRYMEKYHQDSENSPKHVLLCMLKDIGLFYMDGEVPSDDPALAAASSYTFLCHCSPLGIAARPLLFYKAKYVEGQTNMDYELGLLMTLLNQVSIYIYQRKDLEDIEESLRKGRKYGYYKPDQVKRVIKLLRDEGDIIEKLNSESNLFVYETSKYISLAGYSDEELKGFIDTTSFAFEFHNHETLAHTITTAKIAYELALKCKMTKETADIIELAGRVHDIGKIRVPREILCYPGRLEGKDLAEMQRHVVYTREIIEGCFSYKIVEIASNHHEKLDGSGYPRGLKAIDLSSADKIITVADICSALYCRRSYKAAFTDEKIQEILLSDAKAGKIDTRIVEHLCNSYDEIMAVAKEAEASVLEKYKSMKAEYEALIRSNALRKFFEEEEYIPSSDEEPVNNNACHETEEFIEGVYNSSSEEVIYVDEEGNEIDYDPSLEYNDERYEPTEDEPVEEVEETIESPIEEDKEDITPMDESEFQPEDIKYEDVPEAEFNEPETETEEIDEFEAYINSLAEEEDKEELPVSESETEAESEENEVDEFEAYINSLAEETESEETKEIESIESEPKTIEEPKKEVKKNKGMFTRPLKDFDPFADPFGEVEKKEAPKEEKKEEVKAEEEPVKKEETKEVEEDSDYVTSYFSEEELEDDNEVELSESKEDNEESEDFDDEDDESDDDDFDDEDDDEDEENLDEDDDPRHQRFFNSSYNKMYIVNSNKKKN